MGSDEQVVQRDIAHIIRDAQTALRQIQGGSLLITGGAGFLGYYLVQSLLAANRGAEQPTQVTLLDNFMRGIPPWLNRVQTDPNLRIIQHDITQPLPDDVSQSRWLIHGASIASPTYYRQHPIETMDANIIGLRQLLDLSASDPDIRGVLFFSSSEVYGDPSQEWIPTPEHYNGNVSCTGPRACYDESKRYGETLCVNFARARGVPVKIVRPFNNYGPGLPINDRRVLPDFARSILAGDDILMYSDGSPTRTFCYVADAVIGYLKVLVHGRPGEPYNIGTDQGEISIAELARRACKVGKDLFGYRGEVRFTHSEDADYLTDNPNRRCPDITKARTELDYAPTIGLDEGLERSLLWYHGQQRTS